MNYLEVKEEYENAIRVGMALSTKTNCYIPKYSDSDGLAFSKERTDTISKSVADSFTKFGGDFAQIPFAFADYLFDTYHVSPEDCEFLTGISIGIIDAMARMSYEATFNNARKQTKKEIESLSKTLELMESITGVSNLRSIFAEVYKTVTDEENTEENTEEDNNEEDESDV